MGATVAWVKVGQKQNCVQEQYNDIRIERARDQHISVLARMRMPRKERP